MMATNNSPQKPVLLGFVDSEIPPKDSSRMNFTVNKIGGHPDWPIPDCKAPSCSGCGRKQVLVIQMYAPVIASDDHRTLYFFACLVPKCWGKQHSWTCIRAQVVAPPQPEVVEDNSKCGIVPFFEETEDWASGSESSDLDDEDNANENLCDNAIFNLTNQNLVPTTSAAINNSQKNKVACDNFNSNNSNTNTCTQDMDTGIVSVQLGELNLNQGSEKGAVGGKPAAEGGDDDEAPSAFIEESEDDIVAVDSPEQPKDDILKLFEVPLNHYEWLESLCPFYINVIEEPPKENRRGVATGVRISNNEGCASETAYVEDMPVHGDEMFHKFKKKIDNAPSQILRYCKDTNNGPLLLRPQRIAAMFCNECGSRLNFEAQVMPQLILHLKPNNVGNGEENSVNKQSSKGKNINKSPQKKLDNDSRDLHTKTKSTTEDVDLKSKGRKNIPIGGVVEFGTVLVFSCEKSCWKGKPVAETVIVQEQVF